METLAIHGGKPARSTPLPPNYPGAVVMGEEEAGALAAVIRAQSPFRYYGPNAPQAVQSLEDRIAGDIGVPYALAVSSGTAALIVALKALGIGYGDKVIVPANTFVATAGAVVCCNAVPVFADIDDSLGLDPGDLERVYDDEVKAIICVPILGNPCEMDPIMAFARSQGIPVIEDVAQSCGAKYKGHWCGTYGDIGTFSFQMNKIITAGEGGAVVTSAPGLFERAVRYHDQGLFRDKERYGFGSDDADSAFAGQNYRMSELIGAVLSEQWNKLGALNRMTKANWHSVHSRLITELPALRHRRIIDEDGHLGSNYGMILPTKEAAAAFNHALAAENIGTFLLYCGKPVYMAPQFFRQRSAERGSFPFDYPFAQPVRYTEAMCPRAVDLMSRTVYLPISPLLTETDIEEIAAGMIKVYRGLCIESLVE
ncbi:DegT/DnrJ/EryC1/StrS family aminotransferase [Paenibacillus silvisoli]|uniref:DegT/DnrJ/EryC1/StrS family aminotransferase n=1 Tax=Paenibacillus silvisoli TaxID=3110539 RepID=UPI0028056A9E|nr:DegT/DnrJ/EryC1/StrS family aminotransferase [Paenibacillus silvisoli]